MAGQTKKGRGDTLIAVVAIVALMLLWQRSFTVAAFQSVRSVFVAPERPVKNLTYLCDGHKSFQAIFYPENVHLHLDNGKNYIVPRTNAAPATTYADARDSLTFVDLGNASYLKVAGATAYANCVPGVSNYS